MNINEKSLTIILETEYILINNKIENERFSYIWKDKVFENKDSAFTELTEYVNSTLDKGAEQLTKEEHDEITKYFNTTPILIQKGSYLKSFKIGHTAFVYSVRTIKVS
jgi:hypothetical protein